MGKGFEKLRRRVMTIIAVASCVMATGCETAPDRVKSERSLTLILAPARNEYLRQFNHWAHEPLTDDEKQQVREFADETDSAFEREMDPQAPPVLPAFSG
jgi:hypothetical protein